MAAHNGKAGASAVVIGASMGGLLAARALADHFEQVTLLERDAFPAAGVNRKGVPQGKHLHVLLERGQHILEGYFPGLTDELAAQGAVTIEDVSANVRWFNRGAYHQPDVSDLSGVGVSRPLLEGLVRERVLALPNVQAEQGCNVLGLLMSTDKGRVIGARLDRRQANTGEGQLLADLVVDASGRGSRSPAWLEDHGYTRPAVEEVRVGLGYTTCYYRREPEHLPGLDGIVVMPTPPDTRLATMLAQDGDRWVVTQGSYFGDIPTAYQGFLDAARRLPAPEIYNVIKGAEPLGAPVAYTFPSSLRHRYDKLSRFPDGFLLLGDALCSFNPIYAQGMTVAALEAQALSKCLTQGRNRLARRFFAQTSKIIDESWNAAVGNDLNYPQVEGARSPMIRFINWYLDKLHIAAHHDPEVSIAFLKVINMSAPAPSMLHPRIVWRVLKGNLRQNPRDTIPSVAHPGQP